MESNWSVLVCWWMKRMPLYGEGTNGEQCYRQFITDVLGDLDYLIVDMPQVRWYSSYVDANGTCYRVQWSSPPGCTGRCKERLIAMFGRGAIECPPVIRAGEKPGYFTPTKLPVLYFWAFGWIWSAVPWPRKAFEKDSGLRVCTKRKRAFGASVVVRSVSMRNANIAAEKISETV